MLEAPISKSKKLVKLSKDEVLALVNILVLALIIPPAKRVIRVETIIDLLTQRINKTTTYSSTLDDKTIIRLVDAVLSRLRGPWAANCITRSIILHKLLKERGLNSSIHFGVCELHDTYRGHAWVESNGLPIGEPQEAKIYTLHSYPSNEV